LSDYRKIWQGVGGESDVCQTAIKYYKCNSCGCLWKFIYPEFPSVGQILKFSDGIFAEKRSNWVDMQKSATKIDKPKIIMLNMRTARHNYFSKKDKTVMIGSPQIYPSELTGEIMKYLSRNNTADLAYLLWMVSGKESSYLLVLSSRISLKVLYAEIGDVCYPYLGHNYFEIIPFDSPLAQSVIKGKTPFYTGGGSLDKKAEINYAFVRREDFKNFAKEVANNLEKIGGYGHLSRALDDWNTTFFTTSSEFFGELGIILKKVRVIGSLDESVRSNIDSCISKIARL
jgi:hypothetical protein